MNLLLLLSCTPTHVYEAEKESRASYVRELKEKFAHTHDVFSPSDIGDDFRDAFHVDHNDAAAVRTYEKCAQKAWLNCLSSVASYLKTTNSSTSEKEREVLPFLLPSEDRGVSCTSSNIVLQYGDVPSLELRFISELEAQILAFKAVDPESRIDERKAAKRAYEILVGAAPGQRGEKTASEILLRQEVLNLIRGRKRLYTGRGECLWEDMIFVRDALKKTHNDESIRLLLSEIKVSVPSSMLQNGEKIVDTPGTNDSDPFNSENTRNAVDKATDVFVITRRGLNNNADLRSVISGHPTLMSRLLNANDRLRVRVVHYFEGNGERPTMEGFVEGFGSALSTRVTTALQDSEDAMKMVLANALEQQNQQQDQSRRLSDAEIESQAEALISNKVVFRDIWPTSFASEMLYSKLHRTFRADVLETFEKKTNGLWLFGCVMAERHAVCEAEAGGVRRALESARSLIENSQVQPTVVRPLSEEARKKAKNFASNREALALNAEAHCKHWGDRLLEDFLQNSY